MSWMTNHHELEQVILHANPIPPEFPFGVPITDGVWSNIQNDAGLQPLIHELREEAERAKQEAEVPSLPYHLFKLYQAQGSRVEYEQPYFDRRRRLLGLALTTLIDNTDSYLETLQNLIWEICREYTWCVPAHIQEPFRLKPVQQIDLFAAETGHALAETLYLLKDKLDVQVQKLIQDEIEHRIFEPMFNHPQLMHWETLPVNWSAVCAGAIGMTAFLLVDDRIRLSGMIQRLMRSMACFLKGFEPDGGCAEGMNYWNYGFGYYVYFSEMLHVFTGGQVDLLKEEKVLEIAGFPAKSALTDHDYVMYSDTLDGLPTHTGLLSRLRHRLGCDIPCMHQVTSLHGDHCYRWPHTARNLLWTDAELFNHPLKPGMHYFQDLKWLIYRSRMEGSNIAFSAKGGHNDEPHNHNDLGHFIVNINGENLLTDLGAGIYTSEYFGPERYKVLHTSSYGHSVPVINGQPQRAGKQFKADVKHIEETAEGVQFMLDLSQAYDAEASGLFHFTRAFSFSVQPMDSTVNLILQDQFRFRESSNEIQESFISLCKPELEQGQAIWEGQKGSLKLRYDEEVFKPLIQKTSTFDHLGKPMIVHVLHLFALITNREYNARFELIGTVSMDH